jgi:hypothetical protein
MKASTTIIYIVLAQCLLTNQNSVEHIPRVLHLHLHTAAVCVLDDDLYLHIMLGCAHVHKAHGGAVDRRGQQNTIFGTFIGLTK